MISPTYDLEERELRFRQQGRLSGSAQPATQVDIQHIFEKAKPTVWVSLRVDEVFYCGGRSISVPPRTPPPDLRGIPIPGRRTFEESPSAPHASFEDGRPSSRPVTPEDVKHALNRRFVPIQGRKKEGKPLSPRVFECLDGSQTERDLVAERKALFLHIPIEDKRLPDDYRIDELLKLYDKFKTDPEMRIHFHCAGGKGRTSTAMALFHLLDKPTRLIHELFVWLDSWGNKMQTKTEKERNDPTFWAQFQTFAQNRKPGDLWTDYIEDLE